MPERSARGLARLLAFVAGATTVLGFEPFGFAWLPGVLLALLFVQWRNATPREAAWRGLFFGLGLFGCGVPWLYVALANFGEMAALPAAIATAGVAAYLALWPALAGYVAARLTPAGSVSRLVAAAGAWTLAEWLRGYVFTGFPWLVVGYAAPAHGALAGYAPIGGVFLVSLAYAAIAACIAYVVDALVAPHGRVAVPLVVAALLVGAGAALSRIAWTTPVDPPLAVSLVQGNVEQDVKFDPGFRQRTFDLYRGLVARSQGTLVVLPESAFPMFAEHVPAEVVQELADVGARRGGLVLVGLFTAEPPLPGTRDPRYYNTVAALGADDVVLYRKKHLVPFGESIPLKPLVAPIVDALLSIPLSDQTPGAPDQPAFAVAGHRVAVNICYEDAFGSELIGPARAADLLVNVTNDAWYGHSIAAYQHNQIAAMRARELGRPLLRATNTGITSAIDADGREIARLPWFTAGVLEVTVQGRRGQTPYARVGDAGVLVASAALLLGAMLAATRRRQGAPAPPQAPAA